MDWGGWGREFAEGVSDWERCGAVNGLVRRGTAELQGLKPDFAVRLHGAAEAAPHKPGSSRRTGCATSVKLEPTRWASAAVPVLIAARQASPCKGGSKLPHSKMGVRRGDLFLGFVVLGFGAGVVGNLDCFAGRGAIGGGAEVLDWPGYWEA